MGISTFPTCLRSIGTLTTEIYNRTDINGNTHIYKQTHTKLILFFTLDRVKTNPQRKEKKKKRRRRLPLNAVRLDPTTSLCSKTVQDIIMNFPED